MLLESQDRLKKKSGKNILACTVVTVHLGGRVVSNTVLSLALRDFRINFLLKTVRLHIIALSLVNDANFGLP